MFGVTLANSAAFPPNRMSVPRPAMFVATVTLPMRPACATSRLSRAAFSARAFSNDASISASARASTKRSLSVTEVVPTSTGRPDCDARTTYRNRSRHQTGRAGSLLFFTMHLIDCGPNFRVMLSMGTGAMINSCWRERRRDTWQPHPPGHTPCDTQRRRSPCARGAKQSELL